MIWTLNLISLLVAVEAWYKPRVGDRVAFLIIISPDSREAFKVSVFVGVEYCDGNWENLEHLQHMKIST